MKSIDIIFWFIWFLLIAIWNYAYPEASPLLDVVVSVALSILNLILLNFFKKK